MTRDPQRIVGLTDQGMLGVRSAILAKNVAEWLHRDGIERTPSQCLALALYRTRPIVPLKTYTALALPGPNNQPTPGHLGRAADMLDSMGPLEMKAPDAQAEQARLAYKADMVKRGGKSHPWCIATG